MFHCEDCGKLSFSKSGKCGCTPYQVIDQDGDDYTFFAFSEEDAALAFAKWWNEQGDYPLMDDSEIVEVNGKKFAISAEPDIHYSANEV